MSYTIYHIPGIKIGVTQNMKVRMEAQGFSEWEILEVHTDIYEVSNREIELQKEYGYPVDTIPYWKTTLANSYKTEESYQRATQTRIEKGNLGNGGFKNGKAGKSKRSLTYQDAQEIRSKYVPYYYTIKTLSLEYNVTNKVIKDIVGLKTYITP